ncbi:hypothetical protein WJ438_23455 [Streptomyces sp. GD-15H]
MHAAAQAQRHRVPAAHARGGEPGGHPVGGGVEFGVAEAVPALQHCDSVRCAGGLPLEQLVQAARFAEVPVGVVPVLDDPGVLRRGQRAEGTERGTG